MSEIDENAVDISTVEESAKKEFINFGDDSYEADSIYVGINRISFMLSNFSINNAKSTFGEKTELTISSEDKVAYGIYNNLEYDSATELSDGGVVINFKILTKDELRLRKIEKRNRSRTM